MKKITLCICLLLIAVLLAGCAPYYNLNFLDSWQTQTDVGFVICDSVCCVDNRKIDMDKLISEYEPEASLKGIFAVYDSRIYFVFSVGTNDSDNDKVLFNIASVNTKGKDIKVHFSVSLIREEKSDRNEYLINDECSAVNAFYYSGKIILRDRDISVEYDIKNDTTQEYETGKYVFPVYEKYSVKKGKGYEFILTNENSGKELCVNIESIAEKNEYMKQIFALSNKRVWDNETSPLADLFKEVQILDGKIYIIFNIMNWHGEVTSVAFLYDAENDEYQYAGKCFLLDYADNIYLTDYIK